jgi:hypothetical protein
MVGRASLALRELGDAFGNELPRRRFDRSKIAALHAPFEPCFLIGKKCDRHTLLYHENPSTGEGKSAFILYEDAGGAVGAPRVCAIAPAIVVSPVIPPNCIVSTAVLGTMTMVALFRFRPS